MAVPFTQKMAGSHPADIRFINFYASGGGIVLFVFEIDGRNFTVQFFGRLFHGFRRLGKRQGWIDPEVTVVRRPVFVRLQVDVFA